MLNIILYYCCFHGYILHSVASLLCSPSYLVAMPNIFAYASSGYTANKQKKKASDTIFYVLIMYCL